MTTKPRVRTKRPNGQCAACRHAERARFEFLIASGASIQAVAKKFGIPYDSLWRHWHAHVSDERKIALLAGPMKLSEVMDRAAEESASVIDHFAALRTVLFRSMDAATEVGDRNSVAALSGRIIEVLREIGRTTGELVKAGGVTIQNSNVLIMSPAFAQLQRELLMVLAKHPEARQDVIAMFRRLDAEAVNGGAHAIEGRVDG